jgi:hypothetical protein
MQRCGRSAHVGADADDGAAADLAAAVCAPRAQRAFVDAGVARARGMV